MEHNGNEFLPNFVEHLVPLQEKNMVFPKKMGIVSLAAALSALVIVGSFSFLQILAGLVPFLLLGIAFLVWYLWRFVSVEYEYTILGGEMSFEIIYGRRQRKKYYTAPIAKMEKIAPVGERNLSIRDFSQVTREVFCASTRTGDRTWYAIVSEEGGGKTLLFFEMIPKAEKVLRFQNGRAFFS